MKRLVPLVSCLLSLTACGAPAVPMASTANLAALNAMAATRHALGHGLGCKLDGLKPMVDDDSAARSLEAVDTADAAGLPPAVDLRAGCNPHIRDQGYTEGCVAFATTALAEFLLRKEHKPIELSPLYIWSLTRKNEGTLGKNEGTVASDAMKLGHELGFMADQAMPFPEGVSDQAPNFNAMLAWRPSSTDTAQAKKLRPITGVEEITSVHALKKRLSQGLPVIVCLTIFKSFAKVDHSGVIPMPGANDDLLGGHAVLCVGYDNNARRLIIRNSWGADWGDHGYCYLPYDYIKQGGLREGVTTTR